MSVDLVLAVDTIAEQLAPIVFQDQPLRVVKNLADIQPPCAWVALESLDHYNVGGEAQLSVFLISGDIDEYRAITTLAPLLDDVLEVIAPSDITQCVTVSGTTQQRGLPALQVKTQITI